MRIIILAMIFAMTYSASAQQIIDTKDISELEINKIQFFSIITSTDETRVVHLLKQKKELYARLYDQELNSTGKDIFHEKLKFKYTSISGHSNKENRFTVYLNDENEKWGLLSLDFDTQAVTSKEYKLKLRSQIFLNSFSVDDSHYVVTIKRHSSIIFIHKLYPDGTHVTTEYDFSATDFSGGLRSISNLSQLMNTDFVNFQTDLIKKDIPLSLRSTNEKVKLYLTDDVISITVDNSRDFTYILRLNTDNNTTDVKVVTKDHMAERSSFEDSNSFLYDNHLFVVKSTFEEMKFSVVNLSDLSVVKTFTTQKNEDIYFKNTPVLNQKAGNKEAREINNTEDFLKKITNSKPAISLHHQDSKLIVTIGASKEDNSEKETIATISVLLTGGVGTWAISMANRNALDNDFLNYSRTKTTRFQTVLDTSFNHLVEAPIEENVFDKIKKYDLENKIQGFKALYKLNNKFYYNFIDEDTNQIKTVEFSK